MRIYLLSLAFVAACGQAPSGQTPSTGTDQGAGVSPVVAPTPAAAAPTFKAVKASSVQTTTAVPAEATDGTIRLTGSAQTLPTCDSTAVGETYYLLDKGQFEACGEDGTWAVIDLRGAAGADGKDGAAGAVGAQGVAGATGAVGATGAQGAAGPTGATGATGANGVTGGIGVYEVGNNKFVGYAVDNSTLMLPDGGFMYLNFSTGTWLGTYGYDSNSNIGAGCMFLAQNCTGTCYLQSAAANDPITIPIKNSVVYDGTTFWKYTGSEVDAGQQTYHSDRIGTQCTNLPGGLIFPHGWAMTVQETMPTGVTYPFGDLYFQLVTP
jgi:hypothetical protein